MKEKEEKKSIAALGLTDRLFTVPNLLSVLRIVLAILFCILFDSQETLAKNWPALVCLALNAVSDCVDGRIARAFHQVSELGKVIDPIADYVTKFSLIFCFLRKYRYLLGFMLLFLIRICIVSAVGFRTVQLLGKNQGAILAGKADTVVFYAVMLALVIVPGMPTVLAYTLVCISSVMMIIALIFYLLHFYRLRREFRQSAGVGDRDKKSGA